MPKPLTITAVPFKPSRLSIPPSPFSPRLPLPPPSPPKAGLLVSAGNKRELSSPSTPPPSPPLKWIWQCHICHRAYPLGTTRRCLDDGHYFCSGVTTVKTWRASVNRRRSKRTKKHQACASEFDYSGWKAFGEWRRNEGAIRNASFTDLVGFSTHDDSKNKVARSCWDGCDFPSECRWGSHHGAQASSAASPILPSPEGGQEEEDPLTIVGIELAPTQLLQADSIKLDTDFTPPTTFDDILDRHQEGELSPLSPKDLRDRFWDGILDSARQRRSRKSAKAHSPLALHPVIEEDEEPDNLVRAEPVFLHHNSGVHPSSRSAEGTLSQRRFDALPEAEQEWSLQVPKPAVVAGHGFDFGFEITGDGMDAGIQRVESEAKGRKKSNNKRNQRRRK